MASVTVSASKTSTPRPRRLPSVSKYLARTERIWLPVGPGWITSKPIPPNIRTKVREAYADLASKRGIEVRTPLGGPPNDSNFKFGKRWQYLRLNDERRDLLADAIFLVENHIESKGNGHPFSPVVISLNTVRNRIYDEIGVNEW